MIGLVTGNTAPWLVLILFGGLLGPLAFLMLPGVSFVAQGSRGRFSLAHTEFYWLVAAVVSTVSFLM